MKCDICGTSRDVIKRRFEDGPRLDNDTKEAYFAMCPWCSINRPLVGWELKKDAE